MSFGGRPPKPEPPTLVRITQKCRQVFVIFQGMAGRLMIHPLEFMNQTRLANRNLVVLRDHSGAYYQRGLSPELPDIPSMIGWIKSTLQTMPHASDVYCLGSSSGAYAALLCGHLIEAKRVWAFAPPTNLNRIWETEKIDAQDRTYADLRAFLQPGNGITQYHIHYNESSIPDRNAALYLQDCPGVQLFPADGEGHGVIVHLAATRTLGRLFPAYVAAEPPAA